MTADAPAADPHRVRPAAGGPARNALLRALRVTVAGCLAFYPLRYGFDDSTAALYGLFAVIALGALSEVTGTPAARTRTYLAAVGVGAVLVTAGTLAAVNTVVAAAGMLVVGFVVAYAGVGGPRIVGIANGLQLFYILPCFPPFAPDTLDHRIAGLVVGGLLLTAADRLLWPAPGPPRPPRGWPWRRRPSRPTPPRCGPCYATRQPPPARRRLPGRPRATPRMPSGWHTSRWRNARSGPAGATAGCSPRMPRSASREGAWPTSAAWSVSLAGCRTP
jgi:hypothetical protein